MHQRVNFHLHCSRIEPSLKIHIFPLFINIQNCKNFKTILKSNTNHCIFNINQITYGIRRNFIFSATHNSYSVLD